MYINEYRLAYILCIYSLFGGVLFIEYRVSSRVRKFEFESSQVNLNLNFFNSNSKFPTRIRSFQLELEILNLNSNSSTRTFQLELFNSNSNFSTRTRSSSLDSILATRTKLILPICSVVRFFSFLYRIRPSLNHSSSWTKLNQGNLTNNFDEFDIEPTMVILFKS